MKRTLMLLLVLASLALVLTGCPNPLSEYTLTLHVSPAGAGTVSSNPLGPFFSSGQVVHLTAVPATGYVFVSWGGTNGGEVDGSNAITMNDFKSVTAVFAQIPVDINVAVSPAGSGTVTQMLTMGKNTWASGDDIQLTANANTGYRFDHWEEGGLAVSSTNPWTLANVTADRNLTAVFVEGTAKAWNFLVYLDGDNNLESYAIGDLNEMEQIGSTADVNILVLMDRIAGYDTSNGNWTGTRLYYVTKDADTSTISSTLVADYGELDMSDPNTLKDFVVYCQANYPAQHTALTLWNHGGGVYPRAAAPGAKQKSGAKAESTGKPGGLRGICWDDTTGAGALDCLTSAEVAAALSQARTATGQKLDLINMDACLMQMIEVAYEWRNEANYLVGSEETVPGYGNDYDVVLGHLTGTPAMSAAALATALVDDYAAYYAASGNTTYSALDLGTPFTSLMSAFGSLATALKNTTNTAGVDSAWNYTTCFSGLYYEINDLYDFCQELSGRCTDTAVTAAAANVRTAMSSAVIHHHETGGYIGKAYGLSVLIPDSSAWPYYSAGYSTLACSVAYDWDAFVARFLTW